MEVLRYFLEVLAVGVLMQALAVLSGYLIVVPNGQGVVPFPSMIVEVLATLHAKVSVATMCPFNSSTSKRAGVVLSPDTFWAFGRPSSEPTSEDSRTIKH